MLAQLRLFLIAIFFTSTFCANGFFNMNDIEYVRKYLKEKCATLTLYNVVTGGGAAMYAYSSFASYLSAIDTTLKVGSAGASLASKVTSAGGAVVSGGLSIAKAASPYFLTVGIKLLPVAPWLGVFLAGVAVNKWGKESFNYVVDYIAAHKKSDENDSIIEDTHAGLLAGRHEWSNIRGNMMATLDQREKVPVMVGGPENQRASGGGVDFKNPFVGISDKNEQDLSESKSKAANKQTRKENKQREERKKQKQENIALLSTRVGAMDRAFTDFLSRVKEAESERKVQWNELQESVIQCKQQIQEVYCNIKGLCDLLQKQYVDNTVEMKNCREQMQKNTQHNEELLRQTKTVAKECNNLIKPLVGALYMAHAALESGFEVPVNFFGAKMPRVFEGLHANVSDFFEPKSQSRQPLFITYNSNTPEETNA